MLWLDLDHGLEDYFPAMAINVRVMVKRHLIVLCPHFR